jgi:hypothetical protein
MQSRNKGSLTPDQAAAHYFLAELRTRIPRHTHREARVLEDLWQVFKQARETMKKHPGCRHFARAVAETLNIELRPFIDKWHRAQTEDRLNDRDVADEFRADLAQLQEGLRRFVAKLYDMAYDGQREYPIDFA